jgi:N-methylhydantoinase B
VARRDDFDRRLAVGAQAVTVDPITLAVYGRALAGVAREMGTVLIRGSYSSNIKERRDCSTALFDRSGRCLAQAAHIPVHLGAMPEAVRAVIACEPRPGDAFILNDPYQGGSHLPDVTLVSTLTIDGAITGYAVSRAHYAEIGGKTPGSMPSDSRTIYEEGLVLPPVRLVDRGKLNLDILQIVAANSRTPKICAGDLHAQLGAADVAHRRMSEMYARFGGQTMVQAADDLIGYAARLVRAFVGALPDGRYAAETVIEGDGAVDEDIVIRVTVAVLGTSITFDFTGTSDAVAGNVNCPLAVTRAACTFALRTLVPDVPMNAGVDDCIAVRAVPGSLVCAQRPSAVVAGNVETSQRIADCALSALSAVADVPAAGQGTMNNLVVGGEGWAYYETLGGGQGASSIGPGDSGVHVGMSNTLNTPIESLEIEFPLRVERYELRRGSGGDGRHAGGDGLERAIRVLAPATLNILSDRRRHRPEGRHGGSAGALGENMLNGELLPAKTSRCLTPNDLICIRTPGGGGWGTRQPRETQ